MFHESKSRGSGVMRRPGVIGDPTPPPTYPTDARIDRRLAEMRKYCRRRAIINFFVLLMGQHANRCSSSYMSCNSIGWKVEDGHNFNVARMAISYCDINLAQPLYEAEVFVTYKRLQRKHSWRGCVRDRGPGIPTYIPTFSLLGLDHGCRGPQLL